MVNKFIYYINNRLRKYFNKKEIAKQYRKIIKENKDIFLKVTKFDNSEKGRCFIFGNGPSLNDINFSDFKNEDIFVLNLISKHKDFSILNPKYYFVFDPFLFNDNCDHTRKELILKVLLDNENITMFTDSSFANTKLAISLKKIGNLYFLKPYNKLRDYIDLSPKLSRPIPAFANVALYAIYVALSLGYSDIYLVGCDETNILTSINAQMGKVEPSSYSYKLDENEMKQIIRTSTIRPFSDTLYSYADMFSDFALIGEYAKKNNCNIFNCSEKSLLKCFKYCNVEDVLNDIDKSH